MELGWTLPFYIVYISQTHLQQRSPKTLANYVHFFLKVWAKKMNLILQSDWFPAQAEFPDLAHGQQNGLYAAWDSHRMQNHFTVRGTNTWKFFSPKSISFCTNHCKCEKTNIWLSSQKSQVFILLMAILPIVCRLLFVHYLHRFTCGLLQLNWKLPKLSMERGHGHHGTYI